jgi:poly-gamma-glutamate synthesis protein (capsule biosynthesis protein)
MKKQLQEKATHDSSLIKLFLCGDVMTGRGIDQVLPYPSEPTLHESYVKNAEEYVRLAEKANGIIPKPVSFSYIWGAALEEFDRAAPDLRLINLETSVTKSDEFWRGKEIHYRMNPENVDCITSAGINYCSLANNHVLDWGYSGLNETLETLKKANVKTSGAGENIDQAELPAVMEVDDKGRVLVYSFGSLTSGVPHSWAASKNTSGVNLLEATSFQAIKERIAATKRAEDIVVFSVHWGPNWGYEIPFEQRDFAHKLIDDAGVDVVYGHSSHHVKGIEVYRGKLILYGCGDFLNDYEGIGGYEEFRSDLSLMYFASLEADTGKLVSLRMSVTQVKRFTINHASNVNVLWMQNMLSRKSERFGTRVHLDAAGNLVIPALNKGAIDTREHNSP